MAPPSRNQYTAEDLQRAGDRILRRIMSRLQRKQDFDPAIFVIGPEGEPIKVLVERDGLNSDAYKERTFAAVRTHAKEIRAQAVIMATDGFVHVYSKEEEQRLATDPEYRQRHDLYRDASIDDLVAAGFGRKVDAILLMCQTPLYSILIQQHYERAGTDGRHIVFGERIIAD